MTTRLPAWAARRTATSAGTRASPLSSPRKSRTRTSASRGSAANRRSSRGRSARRGRTCASPADSRVVVALDRVVRAQVALDRPRGPRRRCRRASWRSGRTRSTRRPRPGRAPSRPPSGRGRDGRGGRSSRATAWRSPGRPRPSPGRRRRRGTRSGTRRRSAAGGSAGRPSAGRRGTSAATGRGTSLGDAGARSGGGDADRRGGPRAAAGAGRGSGPPSAAAATPAGGRAGWTRARWSPPSSRRCTGTSDSPRRTRSRHGRSPPAAGVRTGRMEESPRRVKVAARPGRAWNRHPRGRDRPRRKGRSDASPGDHPAHPAATGHSAAGRDRSGKYPGAAPGAPPAPERARLARARHAGGRVPGVARGRAGVILD